MSRSDQLSYPKSPGGIYRRKQNDILESVSGQRYCTSCSKLKPREQVKIYKSTSGRTALPRCDECQARRIAAMKAKR